MANAFMPSAFASMAGAGQDTLEQIMKQRLFEQQLLQSQVGMQRQVNADLEQSRRFDAQERYQRGVIDARLQGIEAKAASDSAKLDAKVTGEQAQRNVLGQIADLMAAGNYDAADQLRVRHGLPSNIVTRPKKEETPAERKQRIYEEAMERRRAEADADKLYPKPVKASGGPKPKAEDLTAPPALLEEITRYRDMGLPEWRDADTAMASIRANWRKLQQQFGNSLDLNTVIRKLGNVYGTKVKTKRGDDDFPDDGYPQ